MAKPTGRKVGGSYHGKDMNAATKLRRKRSWERCNRTGGKKDRNVARSSKGKFKSRAELYAKTDHPLSTKHRPA